MEEIWKAIPGYEGVYEASSLGRIKSLERIVVKRDSRGNPWYCPQTEKIRKLGLHDCGYLNVSLNSKTFFVHRIIGLTFLKAPTTKMDINHKNGIKTDNRADNLEWCTRSENIIHALKIGLKVTAKGDKSPRTKITTETVHDVLNLIRQGLPHRVIAARLNISNCLVSKIRNKKSWHCESVEYNAIPKMLKDGSRVAYSIKS